MARFGNGGVVRNVRPHALKLGYRTLTVRAYWQVPRLNLGSFDLSEDPHRQSHRNAPLEQRAQRGQVYLGIMPSGENG